MAYHVLQFGTDGCPTQLSQAHIYHSQRWGKVIKVDHLSCWPENTLQLEMNTRNMHASSVYMLEACDINFIYTLHDVHVRCMHMTCGRHNYARS